MTVGDAMLATAIALLLGIAGHLLYHVIIRGRERRRIRKHQRQLAFLIGDMEGKP